MKEQAQTLAPEAEDRPREAVERLVQLYEATAKTDEAAKWQAELRRFKPKGSPGKKP